MDFYFFFRLLFYSFNLFHFHCTNRNLILNFFQEKVGSFSQQLFRATPFDRILAWESLQFHKKWSIISSITDLYIIYVVSIQIFITKILKSFKNHVFTLFCLLFEVRTQTVRTALGKLKAQADLKRNNCNKGHETF